MLLERLVVMVQSVKTSRKISNVSRTFLYLYQKKLDITVRGECYMPRASLIKSILLVKKTVSQSLLIHEMLLQEPFRQLDTGVVAKRNLATFLYQEASPSTRDSQEKVLNHLEQLGFVVNPRRLLAHSIGRSLAVYPRSRSRKRPIVI